MITTKIDIVIDRPAADVFAVLSDVTQNPTWQNGMKSCVWTTEPPLRIGSRYEQKAQFAGKDINSVFEVVEHEPGRRLKATTISGTFPITFTRWVEAKDDGSTRVQALIEGDSSGVFRMLEPIIGPLVRRTIRKDYRKLKAMLER